MCCWRSSLVRACFSSCADVIYEVPTEKGTLQTENSPFVYVYVCVCDCVCACVNVCKCKWVHVSCTYRVTRHCKILTLKKQARNFDVRLDQQPSAA